MIIIEVNAVQFGKRIELELEEWTTVAQLTRCVEQLVLPGNDFVNNDGSICGYMLSLDLYGALPMDGTLEDIGIRNGMRLMYVLMGSSISNTYEAANYDAG